MLFYAKYPIALKICTNFSEIIFWPFPKRFNHCAKKIQKVLMNRMMRIYHLRTQLSSRQIGNSFDDLARYILTSKWPWIPLVTSSFNFQKSDILMFLELSIYAFLIYPPWIYILQWLPTFFKKDHLMRNLSQAARICQMPSIMGIRLRHFVTFLGFPNSLVNGAYNLP